MNILTNSQYITRGGRTAFLGVDGVAPYVYSVESGGIGGSINALGVYTAPFAYGVDTIKVVDDNADEETIQVFVLDYLLLVANIIENFMNLPAGSIWIWNQKIKEPTDGRLFITLQELSCKPFSNNLRMIDGENRQYTNFQSQVSIDIESRTTEAMHRKEEVIMALRSQYSENQQTLNGFKIGTIPINFTNLSNLEGSSIPYKYNITTQILYAKYFDDAQSSYYDDFDIEINTNTEQQKTIEAVQDE